MIFSRLKDSCHWRTRTGLGTRSKEGTLKTDIERMLPIDWVSGIWSRGVGRLPATNAEVVMPSVWAMRTVVGKGGMFDNMKLRIQFFCMANGFEEGSGWNFSA